jgi:hypothetical protein
LLNQRPPLGFESAAPQFQLLAAAPKLLRPDEIRLVEIGDSPTLGRDGVDLTVEPSNLGGKQLVTSRLPSR